jgi:hypothetical protein
VKNDDENRCSQEANIIQTRFTILIIDSNNRIPTKVSVPIPIREEYCGPKQPQEISRPPQKANN